MIKTSNLLSNVPLSIPEVGDASVVVPPLYLRSGDIPQALPAVSLTATGGGSNAYWCANEIKQAASTGVTIAILTTMSEGVWDIDWDFAAQSDFTNTPLNQGQSENIFYLFGPGAGSIYILAKWLPIANVQQLRSGKQRVTLGVPGFQLRIASQNTGVSQTIYMFARAYVAAAL